MINLLQFSLVISRYNITVCVLTFKFQKVVLQHQLGEVGEVHTSSHITSHHTETTDAGLDSLCIREISVYHTNL